MKLDIDALRKRTAEGKKKSELEEKARKCLEAIAETAKQKQAEEALNLHVANSVEYILKGILEEADKGKNSITKDVGECNGKDSAYQSLLMSKLQEQGLEVKLVRYGSLDPYRETIDRHNDSDYDWRYNLVVTW